MRITIMCKNEYALMFQKWFKLYVIFKKNAESYRGVDAIVFSSK
jgi:hypothetical protein